MTKDGSDSSAPHITIDDVSAESKAQALDDFPEDYWRLATRRRSTVRALMKTLADVEDESHQDEHLPEIENSSFMEQSFTSSTQSTTDRLRCECAIHASGGETNQVVQTLAEYKATHKILRPDHFLSEAFKFKDDMTRKSQKKSFWSHLSTNIFPFLGMLSSYDLRTFLYDLKAGLTIGVVLVPQAIAYAGLANVDAINALVSAIFPLYVYAILGGSRQLSVGPEALSSVLVGVSVLETLREPDYADLRPAQIASTICFICGIIALGLGVLRLGFIDNLLNGFLLVGFVTGVAVLVMTEQLPGLLALPRRPAGNLSSLEKLIQSCQQFPSAKWQPALLGVLVVAFLLAMPEIRKRVKYAWIKNIPDIFILVVLSILLSWAIDFEGHGIPVIGKLQNTLPMPEVPVIDGDLFGRLLQPCIIITLVGFIESISSARGFALKNDYEVTETQELIALGTANVFGSFFSCYPVFGSLPRSRILALSGGKTTVATVIGATVVLVIVLGLSRVFYYLPKSVVAGIVFVAAFKLIEFGEIFFTFRMRKWGEIFFMLITFATTFFLAIEVGIILCLILSTLILVNRNCKPHLSILGRITTDSLHSTSTLNKDDSENTMELRVQVGVVPQPSTSSLLVAPPSLTDVYADIMRQPNAHLVAKILIVAVDAPLQYYNVGELKHQIAVLIKTYEKISNRCLAVDCVRTDSNNGVGGLEAILFDMKHCEDMDSSGIYILKKIVKSFAHHNVAVAFSRLLPVHIDMFSHSGLIDLIGKDMVFATIQEGVAFLKK
ncbi:hypothetical protein M427DRAFT_225313 [Gonapodya prolifera JEL478]|uniref:STAS domain-containing protein n=1 Tax=Gonapodya prolifera (strain JEL478) TaxID=1344416 RepID=A0A139ANM6_GONPJ|nr:hypothetical protein M427DRAFT_225313 [Gonapodya prolifera JEL478]|eukprot:KXS18244.1 hypothetical protein M427DRAFT_225313 [Gonapodya prolifera JEL478]